MTVAFQNLPFDEAIKYLKDKVDLPSEHWTDLWEGMHSRAFVVAGAMKNALLADIHKSAVDAIAKGTTLQQFKKDFAGIVAKHGWTGSALSPVDTPGRLGWRAGVVFNTNMRTAYSAGGYAQMTDPAVLKARPYWRYIGGLSERPRPLHLSWSGTILDAGDPWWGTHYPPNGWGCKCKAVSVGNREMTRRGWVPSPQAPDDGTLAWTNPKTGEAVQVPNGIDPGWAYNPGQAAWGKELSREVMDAWKAQGAKAWEVLTPGDWEKLRLPAFIDQDELRSELDYKTPQTREGAYASLKRILNGEEKIFSIEKNGFRHDTLVNAERLADHVDPNRVPYLPLIEETLADPYEIWMSFERHKGAGQVVLRQRIIKAVSMGKKEGLVFVTNARDGFMEGWTLVPAKNQNYLRNQRYGKLVWRRGTSPSDQGGVR